jgi:alanine racemase
MTTWAEIDCTTAGENFSLVQDEVGRSVTIAAVIKADAYSHGALPMARAFISYGAKFLSVAAPEEGIELRSSGINSSILVLNPVLPGETDTILEHGLTPTVDSLRICELLSEKAGKCAREVKVHVEIDTGMGRTGFYPEEAIPEIAGIAALKNVIIEGIFTHFPSAEDDKEYTLKQIAEFKRLLGELKKARIDIPFKHCANCAGVLAFPESHLNMVRPGLCLYGISPFTEKNAGAASCRQPGIEMKPVLTLKTRIVHKREVPGGKPLSYGRTYVTSRKSCIATLPIGYADGYDRRLSNKAEVLIRGRRVPIVGRICMDRCLIDISDVPKAEVGEEVVLIGKQTCPGESGREESISVEELAEKSGTIPHEFISRIGKRVRRVYSSDYS